MQGPKMVNLYMVLAIVLEAKFSTRFHATRLTIWHFRLSHPHAAIVSYLCNNGFIQVLSKKSSICDSS